MRRNVYIYGVPVPGNANVEDFLPKESLGIVKRMRTVGCDKTMDCEGYLEEHLVKDGSEIMCNGCGKVYSTVTYGKSKYPITEVVLFTVFCLAIMAIIFRILLWLLK